MSQGVLYTPRFSDRLKRLIAERYELVDPDGRTRRENLSAEQCAQVVAWVGSGGAPVDRREMDRFPNLKLIAMYGTGYEGIDLAAARDRGVVICNSPGANSAAVADLAIALMLAVMRDVPRLDAFVRDGKWATRERIHLPQKPGMTGCKIGIYGMGAIGEKIASRAAAFEADVQYHSRQPRQHLPYRYHGSLESLVEWCDVLHIGARASEHNRGIIDAEMLRRLGSNGYIINIARGFLVDEAALIDALRNKTIAGAGLDVLQNEPNISPAFFTLGNVVLSPHQGGHTIQGHEGMQARVMENLDAFFAGRPVPHAVPLS